MKGWKLNERSIRWIMGSGAAVLWGATVVSAVVDLHLRWHLAILLATSLVSAAGIAYTMHALAEAKQAKRNAALKALVQEAVDAIKGAIDTHAERMSSSVFSAQRWATLVFRAETLAGYDAASAKEAQSGDETGPFRTISRL